MHRHYFTSDNLDDLELLEEQLEAAGISTPQIHLLTLDDAGAENHEHIHDVTSLMKTDVVRSWEIGAVVGACMAVVILIVANFSGWTNSAVGWMPFIFLAIIALGFCTWEGGLFGIQRPNHNFERFQNILRQGRHVFFVDLEKGQETTLEEIVTKHSQVEMAGTGSSTFSWIVFLQKRLPRLFRETLP